LGPVIEEKKKLVKERIQKLQEKFKRSRGYNREVFEKQLKQTGDEFIDEILKIKVLDPAMGSGHFLVEATDFLAHALIEALNSEVVFEPSQKEWLIKDKATGYVEGKDEDEIRWARREVVERCIYGVDLNPLAVELAKLSLWLYTVAKGKPLNFLDHHLKCGNSLIGARIDDLTNLPKPKKKKRAEIPAAQGVLFDISPIARDLGPAVGNYILIEDKLSDSLKDIKDKEKIYRDINEKWIGKWRRVADLWTSSYFGVELDSNLYKALSDYLLGKSKRISEDWVKDFADKASKIAEEKRFFHWELEFPEVFFDGHGKRLENPGFDVVIGNPPYLGIRTGRISAEDTSFYVAFFQCSQGNWDICGVMAEQSLNLLNGSGNFGFILPERISTNRDFLPLRELFFRENGPRIYLYCGKAFPDPQVRAGVLIHSRIKRDKWISIGNLAPKEAKIYGNIPIDIITSFPDKPFNQTFTPAIVALLNKIKKISIELVNSVEITRGMECGKNDRNVKSSCDPGMVPVISGEAIARYCLELQGLYIKLGMLPENKYKNPKLFRTIPKILVRFVACELVACIDEVGIANFNTVYNVVLKDKKHYNIHTLLALVNSTLLSWWFKKIFSTEEELYPHIQKYQLDQLPIHRVSFTTPKEEREKLSEEGKELYEKYLENSNWNSLLFFVGQRLKKQYNPDPELVKKHNADPLNKDFQIKEGELVEQSDVVHDILAFLAGKMIEYNKEKNKEIKSFLGWLEREVGAKVEDLTGKTKIKKYYEISVDDLINILKKNRRKLQIDPSRRDFQDKLSAEFDKNLQKLTPLKRKIEMTDRLIDQIVYKLYGLTEEEIKIVEESFQK